jgi:hypothetical protein
LAGASPEAPLRGFTLKGVGLRDTSPTMLEPHAVPSGGDWALVRKTPFFKPFIYTINDQFPTTGSGQT